MKHTHCGCAWKVFKDRNKQLGAALRSPIDAFSELRRARRPNLKAASDHSAWQEPPRSPKTRQSGGAIGSAGDRSGQEQKLRIARGFAR
jgi:hypothetical protein